MNWLREVIVGYFAHVYAWRLHRHGGNVAGPDSEMDHFVDRIAVLPAAALALFFAAIYTVVGGAYPASGGVWLIVVLLIVLPSALIMRICKSERETIRQRGIAIGRGQTGKPYRSLVLFLIPIVALLLSLVAIWFATQPCC